MLAGQLPESVADGTSRQRRPVGPGPRAAVGDRLLEPERVADGVAAVGVAQRAPAGALLVARVIGRAGVEPQPGDGHVGVFGVGEDRSPTCPRRRSPSS